MARNSAAAEASLSFARTEDLDAGTRRSIVEMGNAAFQSQAFDQFFSFIPSGGRHFLAYLDGTPVSHAVVTTRWLQPAGQPPLRTAYVDGVATLPDHQGQGYGSAVMRHLAANIPDYQMACLETEVPGFYQRLGWEVWRGPLAGRGDQGLVPTPEQRGIMVLRLADTPALDLDTLLTIECQPGRIW